MDKLTQSSEFLRRRSTVKFTESLYAVFKSVFLFFLLSLPVLASTCEDYSPINWKEGSVSYRFSITPDEVKATPLWDLKSNPPLAVSNAIELARSSIERSNSDLAGYDLTDVSINRYACMNSDNLYFYSIVYSNYNPMNKGNLSYRAIVLMDGTVKLPIAENANHNSKKSGQVLEIEIEVGGYYVNSEFIGDRYELRDFLDSLDSKSYKEVTVYQDRKAPELSGFALADYLKRSGFAEPSIIKM